MRNVVFASLKLVSIWRSASMKMDQITGFPNNVAWIKWTTKVFTDVIVHGGLVEMVFGRTDSK